MKLSVSIIVSCVLVACQPKNQATTSSAELEKSSVSVFTKDTQVNLYKASLVVPKGWRLAIDDTAGVAIMTYHRRLHNSNDKLVYIEHGFQVSGDRSEPNVVPARLRAGYLRNRIDTTGVLFSDDPRLLEYRKQQGYRYTFETIAGHKAKIFEPKLTGVGYTGVYIDSVGAEGENIAEFLLNAEDLDSLENSELKKVIRTLTLKPYN